jgi:hypothetical protein
MKPHARVQIVHAIARRVRLRAPALAGHRAACERIADALAEQGHERVTARPSTGSVIVEDRGRPLDPEALARRLRALIEAERDDEGHPLGSFRPDRHPGPTRIARTVAHAVAGINADIRAALDQRADLGTLLPVIFAAAGVVEIGATGRLPVPTWFNLLWWSLRSFMTFNVEAVEEELHGSSRARSI